MRWVEFIGPSGVGKSYLFGKLLKKRSAAEWITPDEGFERIFESLNERNEIRLNQKFIIFLKRLLNQKKKNPYKRIPSSYKKEAVDKYGSRFNFLSGIMIKEFATISKLESKKKLEMISWYYENRLLPFIVLYADELNETIVFEDGIFHNNSMVNLGKYIDQIETEGQVIYPDAIICIMADPETIFERIKHRNSITGGTFIQRDYTDKQIKKSVKSSLNKHRAIVSHLKNNNRMVLEIDATENVVKNCRIINQFIRDLNRTK
ncbi:hypothetical protein BH23BAC3_BH23BAC3_30160 [soil metagenome]